MPVHLPACVAKLCDVASKDNSRFALTGIRLSIEPHGGFRAEATDGRRLAIVQEGPYESTELAHKATCDALDQEQESEVSSGIVPADALKKAFKLCKKTRVSVRMSSKEAVILAGQVVQRVPLLEGRFPDVAGVLPNRDPVATMTVDAGLLGSLSNLCADVLKASGDFPAVHVCFYEPPLSGALRPVGMSANGTSGVYVDALIMPVADEKK